MSEMVVTPMRRVPPMVAALMAVALVAAVLLGFGLRAWTEHPVRTVPKVVRVEVPAPVTPNAPTTDGFQCRLGRAC